MIRSGRTYVALAFLASGPIRGQSVDSLPPYRIEGGVSGTIRVWGSVQMGSVLKRWESGFAKYQPAVRFENHLYGALSAIPSLYTGAADLAIGREIWPVETMAFEQVTGYPPLVVQVATGSFDVPTKSDSLEIYVHRDNPIAALTLTQLGATFGSDGVRQGKSALEWGDLGLTADWKRKAIHTYGYKLDNAAMLFFRDLVFQPGMKWNCALQEFGNETAPGNTRVDAGLLILRALAKDPYGIAISNAHYARAEVKPVPLALADGMPPVNPTRESVLNRSYPLTRSVYLFLNRAPGKRLDSRLEEFLRYVLSREGERDVISEGAYLPLPEKILREQLSKLLQDAQTHL